MTGNQMELSARIHGYAVKYKSLAPQIAAPLDEMAARAYQDGALKGKTKRLMAMTAALVHGCRACILYQAGQAIALGATAEECLECIGVAASLGGTMAEGEATRLIAFLEEKGMI